MRKAVSPLDTSGQSRDHAASKPRGKSSCDVQAAYTAIPIVRFECQALTSYAGAFLLQVLFRAIGLKRKLAGCFDHLAGAMSRAYRLDTITLVLVVHLLLGHRRLRHIEFYADDPMICRALGVRTLPNVSTITRAMRSLDESAVAKLRGLSRDLVLDALDRADLARVTIDFDGSVIEARKRWTPISDTWSFFSCYWAPKKWGRRYRFLFYRQTKVVPLQGPLQLGLFEPRDFEFEYKVVLVRKKGSPKTILDFHNGRGSQEGILGELKSETQLDYIPTGSLVANQHFLFCSILAHNLGRELQMRTQPRVRVTSPARPALWLFRKAGTLVRTLIQRAGRITRPRGEFTVTMAANPIAQAEIGDMTARLLADAA